MMLFIKKYWIFLIIAIFIVVTPLVLYWTNFFTFYPSQFQFSDWKDFSEFFGLYISITSVIITFILTIRIIDISDANNKLQKNLQKPVISFVKEEEEGLHYYTVKNVGIGAAINITLYKRESQQSGNYKEMFDKHKLFYSLGPNDCKEEKKVYPKFRFISSCLL